MKTVVALYANSTKARDVVRALREADISRDEISVMANDSSGEFASMVEDHTVDDIATAESPEHEPRDATESAGIGAVAGGVTGLLVGLGALAIPGIGPVIAAGPLAATLIGAGVGAAAGGVIGAFREIGVDPEDAQYYAESIRRGSAVVAVRTEDAAADQAVQIMNRYAPMDLAEEVGRWREEGWDGFDHSGDPYFSDLTDLLVTEGEAPEQQPLIDNETVDSVNVPDLDEESRAYMTNLDSASSGSVEPAPDTIGSALPDEERHPARSSEPHRDEAAEASGDVRVYGVELN